MGSYLIRVLLLLAALVTGALGTFLLLRPRAPALPDTPALVGQVHEVARLETLEVSLYKKVEFRPEAPVSDSMWVDLANWAKDQIHTTSGRAIVFAKAHLGYDFRRIDASRLRVEGMRVDVVLPPLEVQVELLPGETEVIDSNLDSQETAQLLERAREAFVREVSADAKLRERARRSAELSLRALFLSLGFREVRFVETLPTGSAG